MSITRRTTGRPQANANRLQPTKDDYKRLERLLNRPWSPFKSMDAKELQKLGSSFELLEYQPGDIIMQKGVMGRHLYLLEDGTVELFNVKYGQQPVIMTTLTCNKNRVNQVLGKFNSRIFGLTSLRLAVEQPVGARAALGKGSCRVWRMSADAYDISLQNRDSLKQLFAKYASVVMPKTPHGSVSDERLSKKMTQKDFFHAMIESDPNLNSTASKTKDAERPLKVLFSIADADMNDPTGLLSFSEFAALFDLLDNSYSHYDIAFRSFDLNRSGFISRQNFERGIKRRILRRRKTTPPKAEPEAVAEPEAGAKPEAGAEPEAVAVQPALLDEFMFEPSADLIRRYMGTSQSKSSQKSNNHKQQQQAEIELNFGEFSEFFHDLQQEIAAQAFENAADENNCITFEQAVPLIRMIAPAHNKDYMIKNLTQLLAMYGDSKISYPAFRAFSTVLNKFHYIESAIFRQCKRKGRKISRSEFANANMIEGTNWTVSDELTPLQFQIMWDVMSRSKGGEIGPEDLVTKFKWKGTMADIRLEQLEEIATPESAVANNDVLSGVLHFCKEFLEHFAMGSIAGGIGAAAVYPIDLGKTRLQNQVLVEGQAPQYRGVLDAIRKVFVSEGPVGLYRGLFPQLAGVAPEKAIKLTVNDTLRKWFRSWNVGTDEDSISVPLEVLAGAGGGMAQVAFTNPMEIVKIRLQMASMNEASARPSAVNVVKELGLRGLYKGATACFMRDIPFSAIYFPTYATLRKALQGEKEHASALDLFVAGGVAGAPAASLVTPADVIKTRLQTKLPNGSYMYNSMKEASVEIYRNEGFNAFFKGAPARVLRSSPQFAVTLLAYETLQRVLGLDQDENAKYAPPTNAPIGNFGQVGRAAMSSEGVVNRANTLQDRLIWTPVARSATLDNSKSR